MPNNSIAIQPWYSGFAYCTYDVTAGINLGTNFNSYGPPYWSTVNNNVSNNPSGQFIYPITSYSRSQDIATVNLTWTGASPGFGRGSLYAITGLQDINMNATGMVLNASPNSGSGFQIQFINPGQTIATQTTSIGAVNCPQPAWTTGFMWTPTYSTQWEVQQSVVSARFDNAYEQRQPQGIANNTNIWSMVFDNRTDRETKGLMAWVQNMAGVYSAPILIPPSLLFNNPAIKYVLSNPKVNTKSYNQSDITVVARQVLEY
jgi:phage-related protein